MNLLLKVLNEIKNFFRNNILVVNTSLHQLNPCDRLDWRQRPREQKKCSQNQQNKRKDIFVHSYS